MVGVVANFDRVASSFLVHLLVPALTC